MSTVLKVSSFSNVFNEMNSHPAWRGMVRGLDAEKMLRGLKTPYTYILRKGEKSNVEGEENFYITFLDADLVVRHQSLVVTLMSEGWYFENGGGRGPFEDISIDDVIHEFMHCQKGEPIPLVNG